MATSTTRRLHRIIAVLTSAVLILACVAGYLASERWGPRAAEKRRAEFEAARIDAIRGMVSHKAGLFDNHVDSDVARILQPNAVGVYVDTEVRSNPYGMRERRFEWEKPEGTVRIVLLGDSYVFGYGVTPGERMGVHLERLLERRGRGFEGEIQCLHIAITSWNIISECGFLRRQLSELRPDLVVQVVVQNDLDDVSSARGFGAFARFSSQVRKRADALVEKDFRAQEWGVERAVPTPLLFGLDHESRGRYARAAGEIGELARATKATGGRYLLLSNFGMFTPMVHEYLAPELPDEELAFVSFAHFQEEDLQNGPQDPHWNDEGHRRIATLLYGLVHERDLLPMLDLEEWDDAAEAVEEIHGDPRNLEPAEDFVTRNLEILELRSVLDFTAPAVATAAQVYAGIDADGGAAPYVSLILHNDGGSTLEVRGNGLDRPEIANGRARVFVEEFEVGTIPFEKPGPFTFTWPLPPEVRERAYVNVRFESDDYVTIEPRNARCVSFDLERVSIR